MTDNVYIEIDNDICIICLEKINNINDSINVCIRCNVKSHKKCLRIWHRKKRQRVCPICLKTERYYFNSVLQSTSIYNNLDNTNENTNENTKENTNENNLNNILNNEEDINENINENNLNNILNNEEDIDYDEDIDDDIDDEYISDDEDNTFQRLANNNLILVNNNNNSNEIKYICFCLFLMFLFIFSYILSIHNIRLF